MMCNQPKNPLLMAALACVLLFGTTVLAGDSKNVLLHEFAGGDSDGGVPAGLVSDTAGNLYGTTLSGGGSNGGYGTVYELSPPTKERKNWTEQILYSFNGSDGQAPAGALIFDASGNLYGTTLLGGSLRGGTIFELLRENGVWGLNTLYQFPRPFPRPSTGDGSFPEGALLFDQQGNLYGTTAEGGDTNCYSYGCGVVFELSPPAQKGGNWTETILHVFHDTGDGAFPASTLISDVHGNLYGTTYGPDGRKNPNGTVFQLAAPKHLGDSWTMKTLVAIQTLTGQLAMDAAGNIYGTSQGEVGGQGYGGSVFELSPPKNQAGSWKNTILYSFTGPSDGDFPQGGVILDAQGNLYGSTSTGGNLNCGRGNGCGTVFKLKKRGKTWEKSILWEFAGTRAAFPSGDLIWGTDGLLYGTAQNGGIGNCTFGLGCGGVRQFVP